MKKTQLIDNHINSSKFAILQTQDLVFETTTLDFGEIEQSSDGRREFKFTNKSKKSITIDKISPSCGINCIAILDYPHIIEKGDAGVIKLEYNTNRVGPFTKIITLSTDGSQKEIVLTIKGIVK